MQIPRVLSLVLLALLVAACGREAPLPQPTPAAPTAVVQTEPTASAPAEATATPAEGESADPLSGTHWQWVTLTDPAQQVQIEAPMDYTILFSEGDASIRADCNQAVGTYSVGPDQGLTITPGPTTLVACPEGSRGDEFLQKLGQVAVFSIQDGRLLLELPADGGTLEFIPFDPALAAPGIGDPAGTPPAGEATAVPASGEATDVLSGTSWQWVQLTDPTQQVEIENPASYTITFSEGSASIQADCNRSVAAYSVGPDQGLTITPGPTTLAACPEGSRSDEFLQKLGQVAIFSIQDDQLLLELPADGGTLVFARAGSATGVEELPSLVGTTWQWVGLSDPLQQVQIDNPSAYTITFVDDTNVAITADCNQASGTYSADGSGGMTITIGLTTMAACPPGSREQEFLQKLGDVAIYFFQDERLFLELPVDSGTLEFQPQ